MNVKKPFSCDVELSHKSAMTDKRHKLEEVYDTEDDDLARPPPPRIDPRMDSILINWIDIDAYSFSKYKEEPVHIIRFFGVSSKGNSVAVHVRGFSPYFYCDPPSHEFGEYHISQFRENLEARVAQAKRGAETKSIRKHILSIQLCDRQSVYGFSATRHANMLQIFVAAPSLVSVARTILEQGFCPLQNASERSFQTYESNVPYVLRFMVDRGIVGCNWIELPPNMYHQRAPCETQTHCQLEFDVMYDQIVSHEARGQYSRIGKLRTLSFDIECMGRKGHFPDPQHDSVIQIASYIYTHGEDLSACKKIVLVLGGCSPIVGAKVYSFKKEEDLLVAWSDLVRKTDPDLFTGYNIQNFDFPYLLNRAKAIGVAERFELLGRNVGQRATMKSTTFSSSAFGSRESVETKIDGRIMFDMIQYMYRNHKMSSFSLNAVSAEFLGMQKEDVHHSIIADLQRGSDDDRHRLAVYCLKDAFLPLTLMCKLLVLVNYVEMARVTGVPLSFLLTRGQQIKVLSMLYRKAKQFGMVIPVFARQARSSSSGGGGGGEEEDDGVGYEGATVLEPKCGFYPTPIATLDFASLYPSIMRAHNLCYTTLLSPEEALKLPDSDKELSPCGHWFVRDSVRKGLLPIILEELLTARSQAKKDMKNATDDFERDVMNGRQSALKISANSVYGFTGATVGSLPCIPISSSVTAYGRNMIEKTKNMVEAEYTIAKGYPADAEVIYGDTDSVMVRFGVSTVGEALKLGKEAAVMITKIFPFPVSLEFEKVYFPYLLMAKKRYAGLYWTRTDKYDKLDCKGIETVRRDFCQLVRMVIDTCLRKIIIDQRVDEAVHFAKTQISALLQGRIDISLLIISKSLAGKEYKNKQPHVELAEKMRKRDAGSAPVAGDRVPYVIIQAAKGTPVYLKSEDPLYVLENNIPIDTHYYLEQQLSKPLLRLFDSILPDAKILLTGDHTRSVLKLTPSIHVGLMRFTKKSQKCLGCRVPVADDHPCICENCQPRHAELYLKNLTIVRQHESRFSELWTQCQRCQGSFHQNVLCSSADCPIFYMRKKVQKDLADAQQILDKLELF